MVCVVIRSRVPVSQHVGGESARLQVEGRVRRARVCLWAGGLREPVRSQVVPRERGVLPLGAKVQTLPDIIQGGRHQDRCKCSSLPLFELNHVISKIHYHKPDEKCDSVKNWWVGCVSYFSATSLFESNFYEVVKSYSEDRLLLFQPRALKRGRPITEWSPLRVKFWNFHN